MRISSVIIDGKATAGGAYGLDFGAVIALADGLGAANFLFFDLLPEIEAIIVRSYRGDVEE